ncbi:cobalt ABC transporter ATP-binding protein [Salmonella enterica subsp. enterica]|nr:cobalt ABC transporter ATP-binding protein [Salmonella enterica subsp. enterica]
MRHARRHVLISTIQHTGIVAIVGDNGSGKSTLAQLMAGWYPDYLPGDIDGTGLLLGVPIGQLPLVEQSPHHPVGAAIALFTAFRLYL